MSKLQEWQERAQRLALSLKMDIAVVESGGNYQLWPVKFSSGVYVAKYGGGDNELSSINDA